MPRKKDKNTHQVTVITQILKEAQAYRGLNQVESLVESHQSLQHFPVQPLYSLIKSLSPARVAEVLPRLDTTQRQAFLDLDLWSRDDLDVDNFEFWVRAYSELEDEKIQWDFVESTSFLTYLKGRFNIWTFDLEDPVYPDHDYYFLTDDDLLLFEYDETFDAADEVRELIRRLYAKMGVERAYAHLFKLVSDSFSEIQEMEYQDKKYRLAELGMVDYFDALEMESPFSSQEVMDNYIKKKSKLTAEIPPIGKGQTLHATALSAFDDAPDLFERELSRVESEKRRTYLHFNFIRLVNSSISYTGALKDGRIALTKVGKSTRATIELGLSYLQEKVKEGMFAIQTEESLFDYFDFVDLNKFGKTLIRIMQNKINKHLKEADFLTDSQSAFLGRRLGEVLDYSFEAPVKIVATKVNDKPLVVKSYQDYIVWTHQVQTLCDSVQYAKKFYQVYQEMKESHKVSDAFYINYTVDDIDFEAILISSLANHSLGLFDKQNQYKMGLTLKEFRDFTKIFFDSEGAYLASEKVKGHLESFIKKYGLESIYNINDYLSAILADHLEGYHYDELTENDYKHVGGPIILDPGQ